MKTPFADLDAEEELHSLVDQISLAGTSCRGDEYINGEDSLPVCMKYSDDWEVQFFVGLNANSDSQETEDVEGEDQYDLEPSPPNMKRSFQH